MEIRASLLGEQLLLYVGEKAHHKRIVTLKDDQIRHLNRRVIQFSLKIAASIKEIDFAHRSEYAFIKAAKVTTREPLAKVNNRDNFNAFRVNAIFATSAAKVRKFTQEMVV